MNWQIALLAIGWTTFETAYFGWNWAPQSDAELMADCLGFLLMALAFIVPAAR